MSLRALAFAVSTVAWLAAAPTLAQGPKAYHAPRTAYGQPDLQGVWTNATITPLTRDAKYGERNVLTKAEADAAEAATRAQVARADAPTPATLKVTELKNADCGPDGISGFNCGYNQGWKDPGTRLIDINGEKRASIITSPANGQLPPRIASAAGPRRAGRTDNPEGFSLGERCLLSFGSSAGPPMLPLMYNNTYQIVQSKDEIAIDVEMVHDVRHIHLTGGHLPASMKVWMGDSVGHWEGDTLVVETTNMRPEQGLRGGSPNQKVIEKFRRIGPNSLSYQFTVSDPDTYAAPFSGEVQMRTTKGQVYEYACHEGNYALTGMLAGARAEEKKQAEAGGAAKSGGE
ncbi:MAG TPA: hypothetical protein VNW53_01715 [Phenylobacterium sp.]|uniref:hypothetical protein n=1 Tax=Phenylobacterium sp. TaxID=1871053 RepID=UPI002C386298|nr:hypothetical protein [Phenylobacterium sp.]HXA37691.1 hypothetical protein [Phenylobacterium sp.]